MNKTFGRVIKKKFKKIIIIIKKSYILPILNKRIFYYKKLISYDIFNETNIGDYIIVTKSRPLTKTIFWIVSKIIEKVKLI
ncbi:30S ribosomal protein S17 [Candidatus Carsonella ruddii]|uniref:30S ribosomal protein S17 n=1 Tax=Carsonella ruddii TaxID=114186 RepID=A0A2K8KBV6_CARRU|nr:30S ribosomal protein S17 [Candidatus Carsonella ruddii]ATX33396.1 30S ribosomal protein S17 [Candidatus Carsonella ruddii]